MNTPGIKPESLLTSFSKTHLILYTVVALVIHIVLIGITSIPYIFTTRADVVVEETQTVAVEEIIPAAVEKAAAPPVETPVKAVAEERELSEIEKRVTEVAAPEDIPRVPDPLEIPLDMTN